MIRTLVRRANIPFDPATNPYKARSKWPPEFSKLSPKHQFRLERKYKRRTQLKWARPGLMKFTKIAQWSASIGVLVYGVFFLQWDKDDQAFKEIRQWYRSTMDSFWTQPTTPRPSQSPP